MELSDVLSRVELRLKAMKLSADKASSLARKPDAIRNMRRAVKAGDRVGVSTDTIAALAPVLGANPAWLLTGEGVPGATGTRIVGHAGADARPDVVVFTSGQGPFDYDASLPPGASASTVAVEVRGNSMRQIARDGWRVYFDEAEIQEGPVALASLEGELCICWLADGRILLKELHRSRRIGFYILISTNDDPMPDEEVVRAARVTFIAPRGPKPKTDRLIADGHQEVDTK